LLLPRHLSIFKCLVVEIARRAGLFFLESDQMTEIREKIKEMLQPVLEAVGAFAVDIAVRNESGGKLVQVFADTDRGITIAECAQISRELGRELDRTNVVQTSYRLEVSSPGIDKPIRLLRQYHKNVGRRFKVTLRGAVPPIELIGTLRGVKGEQVEFLTDAGETVLIDFSKILESKVELPW